MRTLTRFAGIGLAVTIALFTGLAAPSAAVPPPVSQNYKVLGMGTNYGGQLGNNSTVTSYTPVQALGLPANVRRVVSGATHNLALDSSGYLWGWGENHSGQLGDNTTTGRLAAVRIYGLTGVTQVAAGSSHTLAVRSDGTVWAWGANTYGQLGDGTKLGRTVPTRVPGITNAVAVAGGWFHSIALLADGTVRAWGYNTHGQLGDGTTTERLTPVPVEGISTAVKISAGSAGNGAILADGRLMRWGQNVWGQLGIGNNSIHLTPVHVPSLVNVVAIADSQTNSVFALTGDGRLWAWGYNGGDYLGDGTSIDRSSPVWISGAPSGIVQVAAGGGGSLVVTSAGRVWAWGTIGYNLHYAVPTMLAGITNAVHGSFGSQHIEAVVRIPLIILP